MSLGRKNQDDLDRLAHDPAMRMAVWNRPGEQVLEERLASQPTQSRLLDWLATSADVSKKGSSPESAGNIGSYRGVILSVGLSSSSTMAGLIQSLIQKVFIAIIGCWVKIICFKPR